MIRVNQTPLSVWLMALLLTACGGKTGNIPTEGDAQTPPEGFEGNYFSGSAELILSKPGHPEAPIDLHVWIPNNLNCTGLEYRTSLAADKGKSSFSGNAGELYVGSGTAVLQLSFLEDGKVEINIEPENPVGGGCTLSAVFTKNPARPLAYFGPPPAGSVSPPFDPASVEQEFLLRAQGLGTIPLGSRYYDIPGQFPGAVIEVFQEEDDGPKTCHVNLGTELPVSLICQTDDENNLLSFTVYDPRFKTLDGLHVGMLFSDAMKAASIGKAWVNSLGETLFSVEGTENMVFQINLPSEPMSNIPGEPFMAGTAEGEVPVSDIPLVQGPVIVSIYIHTPVGI